MISMEHKDDKITICSTTRKILQYSFLWPSKKTEIIPGRWQYIRVIVFYLITIPWYLGLAAFNYKYVKKNNEVEIEDVTFLFSMVGNYYGAIVFIKNQPKIALLLRDLSNFETFGKPPGCESLTKKLNKGSRCIFLYTINGLLLWSLSKILEREQCEQITAKEEWHQTCHFPVRIWMPLNGTDFPIYHLTYVYVFFAMQIVSKISLVASYLMLEMSHHIVLRIKHLGEMYLECFKADDMRERLWRCFLYHNEILGYVTRLNECFSSEMFGHITMTAAICACLEKEYIDGACKLCAILYIIGWTLALFIACHGGQHLIDGIETLPHAIWSSEWYRAEVNLQKDVLFMLHRSQKINAVTAGPFSEVSYPLFLAVMKMSYSIYCFLTS